MFVLILTILSVNGAAFRLVQQQAGVPTEIPVEVAAVLELPLTLNNTSLVKTKDGYRLKVMLANSSDSTLAELRYSISIVNSLNEIKPFVTITNSLKLSPGKIEEITFPKVLKPKLAHGDRLVIIAEQVVGSDFLWNVVNSQEFLLAYVNSDYSKAPRVIRTTNFTDAPMKTKVIY